MANNPNPARFSGPAPGELSIWKIRISTLVWAGLFVAFLLSVPVLSDLSLLSLPILLALACVLAFPMAWIWRWIFKSALSRPFIRTWVGGVLCLWFALCGTVAAPVYYLAIDAELRPAIVPTLTLSNGRRTVVLQGMQHVGADQFYKSVLYDMEVALADGYVLFYEGVADSDAQADEWFRQTLSGGKDLGENYRVLGKVCGLSYQIDYMGPLIADEKIRPGRHKTVDVTTREMKTEYDRLMQTNPSFAAAMREKEKTSDGEAPGHTDFLTRFVTWQEKGNKHQQALAGTLCRGVMTALIRRKGSGSPLDPVVLEMRNRHLASQILADPADRIFVTYGAAHLPGVTQLLQRDPQWQLKSVKWMRTIATPEKPEGKL